MLCFVWSLTNLLYKLFKFKLSNISDKINIDNIDQIWWVWRIIEFLLQVWDIQAALVICGLFICGFACLRLRKMYQNFKEIGLFKQIHSFYCFDGVYLPRITRENCIGLR
jgi:hypothetical protein